ncbi:hypothetical protein EOE18_18015 [Novosphingobium umbonatum]|uniref:Uncharacterized protein n=1 Tax=Novosphingobium umbonatum TaxID=1908524 RepID=A0A3S2UQN9_9SPHN|nr:hypothetical protein [Novosphingobium umbonatum]RVU02148.1 hypothetical protein EOE18_18015 [Novosphingobium umbonatum]
MSTILNSPRLIDLGTETQVFESYAALQWRGEEILCRIMVHEAELDANPAEAEVLWHAISLNCKLLADIVAAQEKWLDEHHVNIKAAEDALRKEIRSLNITPAMKEQEKNE